MLNSILIMDIEKLIYLVKNKLGQKWPFLIFRVGLYIALASKLLAISWNAWSDITIDFGEELYSSWRISAGDILYRDITNYYYGPLSYYWNALWFHLFGTGTNTLITVNLILLGILIYLLEDWLIDLSDRFTATFAVLFFISVFAFGRYVVVGNYNYVTPYLHSATHGLILILAMMAFIKRWAKSRRLVWLWLSGIILGLAVMTKIEIFVTAVFTAMAYMGTTFFMERERGKNMVISITNLITASLVPLIVSICAFGYFVPIKKAVSYTFNALLIVGDERFSRINELLFYKRGMGIDDILGNIMIIGGWLWVYLNFALIGVFLALILRNHKHWRLLLTIVITAGVATYFYYFLPQNTLTEAARPLPFIMLAGLVTTAWLTIKQRKEGTGSHALPLYLASFIFSIILLLKMILNARLYHFGFTLAMPATMLLIVILVNRIPKYLNHHRAAGWMFKSLALGLLITISLSFTRLSTSIYSNNNFFCCQENKTDIIKTNQLQGPVLDATLHELESRLKPGQTFTVVPRGIMLNYLLRRQEPTGRLYLLFDILTESDEQNIIDSFAKHPPDFIVFNHIGVSEFGFNYFGKDLSPNLYTWLNKNYKTVWSKGDPPFQPNTRFGVVIAQHVEDKTK